MMPTRLLAKLIKSTSRKIINIRLWIEIHKRLQMMWQKNRFDFSDRKKKGWVGQRLKRRTERELKNDTDAICYQNDCMNITHFITWYSLRNFSKQQQQHQHCLTPINGDGSTTFRQSNWWFWMEGKGFGVKEEEEEGRVKRVRGGWRGREEDEEEEEEGWVEGRGRRERESCKSTQHTITKSYNEKKNKMALGNNIGDVKKRMCDWYM